MHDEDGDDRHDHPGGARGSGRPDGSVDTGRAHVGAGGVPVGVGEDAGARDRNEIDGTASRTHGQGREGTVAAAGGAQSDGDRGGPHPRFRRLGGARRAGGAERAVSTSDSVEVATEPGSDESGVSASAEDVSRLVRFDGYTGDEPDCVIRPVLTSEARRIRPSATIYVDGQPYTLRDVRDLNVGGTRFGSPYYGLTTLERGDPGPSVPMLVTKSGDGGYPETVYWISHLRAEASLPTTSHYPTTGMARRRFMSGIQQASATNAQ
jgi:hypothetical protein